MDENVDFFDNGPAALWETVRAFVSENKSPSRRPEDDDLRQGVNFLKRWGSATKSQLPALKRDYPDLYRAHLMYANPVSEKWMIEAGLLTDAALDSIGEYVNTSLPVVKTYEKYFYNIRPYVKAEGYILSQILMPSIRRGMNARDFDFMFKTVSYFLGWEGFKEFVSFKPLSGATEAFLKTGMEHNVLKLAWMATNRVEINNYNALEVIDKCIALKSLEKEQGMQVAQTEAFNVMNDLLTTCRTAIMSRGEVLTHEPRVAEQIGNKRLLKYGDVIPLEAGVINGNAK